MIIRLTKTIALHDARIAERRAAEHFARRAAEAGRKLHAARTAAGLSLEDVSAAAPAGWTPARLEAMENGTITRRDMPTKLGYVLQAIEKVAATGVVWYGPPALAYSKPPDETPQPTA